MSVDISVIIPQRYSVATLRRLFDSIPDTPRVEILLIDNTPTPITKEDVGIDREYKLLWSSPERHAGGARNVGIENACGKWLVFADADDYFSADAFDMFYKYIDCDADIVYFTPQGIYSDTGEQAPRADAYKLLVNKHLSGEDFVAIRLNYLVPWGKMVRRQFVIDGKFRFDEVRASNDVYFSVLTGFYAKKIDVSNQVTYYVSVSRGSLTRNFAYDVVHSRYLVVLRFNEFLRKNRLSKHQHSVAFYLFTALKYYPQHLPTMIVEAFRYRQNIFIGMSNWVKTYRKQLSLRNEQRQYNIR